MPRIGWRKKQGLLIQTGQTTQYASMPDDGYFKKGLAKSYAVLTTKRHAGTTSITLNGKTENHSNNCVYDRRTKLMWSRYTSDSVGPASDGKLAWTNNGNGEGMFQYCAAANTAKLAAYSDWRIPNLIELLSLQNIENPSHLPSALLFPSFTQVQIWSSSTLKSLTTFAMYLAANYNWTSATDNKTTTFKTILVRGG
jgi:Protein of unknown function (DUF1566)